MKKLFIRMLIPAFLFTACRDNTETKSNGNIPSNVTPKSSTDKNRIHKNIHIMAKPDSIAIDATSTAIIVVDMENDFCAKGGALDQAGFNISIIQKVIAPTAKVLTAARQAGIKIIYLKMGYHADLSDLGSDEAVTLVRRWGVGNTISTPNGTKGRILIRNTWNTEIVPELKPSADDIVIYKTRYSGFYKTNLDSVLRQLGKKYLIITGCTTSVCVESTVRDANFRDYLPVVLEDCTAEPKGFDFSRSNHEASLFIIQANFGWVSNSREFIKALKVQPYSNQSTMQ